MQSEYGNAGADRVGEDVEHVGMAAWNEDLVQLVGGAGKGHHDPGKVGRIAPQSGPQERRHAAEGERVHELVPGEVHDPLHETRLVEHEELHEDGRERQQAGGPDPGRRREREAHG